MCASSRCEQCTFKNNQQVERQRPARNRDHYSGDYAKRAKAVRDVATICWLCGEGAKLDDPWQADHYFPGDPASPLLPAHRSCNVKRSNESRNKKHFDLAEKNMAGENLRVG
jgi:hypothetical protein